MTGRSYTERDLTAWLEATGQTPQPDYVDDLLARTARARQRAAWRFAERWLPMDITARAPTIAGRHVPLRTIAVVALIVLALVVGGVLIAGSRPRVPAPFGPAANGLIVYGAPEGDAWTGTTDFTVPSGDIVAVDPSTGAGRIVVGGPSVDGYPVMSRDGTRVSFVRDVFGGQMLYAVGVNGGSPTALTKQPLPNITDAEWSPDDSSIAFTSAEGDLSSLWIAAADGSGARRVDLGPGLSVVLPHWRPPNAGEILLVGSTQPSRGFFPRYGYRDLWGGGFETAPGSEVRLYVVRKDGSDLHAITPTAGTGYDYGHTAWTPDGTRIVTQREDPGTGVLNARVMTADGTEIRPIRPTIGEASLQPIVSPDGLLVAYADMSSSQYWRLAVTSIDDPTAPIVMGEDVAGAAAAFRWSPDGRSIVVTHHYFKDTWLVDAANGSRTDQSWTIPGYPSWQRNAP